MDAWELWEKQIRKGWVISEEGYEELLNRLRPGDLVRGFVVEPVDEHRTIVNLKGFNVVADCGGVWPKGTRFRARVVSVRPKVVLRLKAAKDRPSAEARLRRRLAAIGAQPTPETIVAARLLIQKGLPVTMENLHAALRLTSEMAGGTQGPVDMVA